MPCPLLPQHPQSNINSCVDFYLEIPLRVQKSTLHRVAGFWLSPLNHSLPPKQQHSNYAVLTKSSQEWSDHCSQPVLPTLTLPLGTICIIFTLIYCDVLYASGSQPGGYKCVRGLCHAAFPILLYRKGLLARCEEWS